MLGHLIFPKHFKKVALKKTGNILSVKDLGGKGIKYYKSYILLVQSVDSSLFGRGESKKK